MKRSISDLVFVFGLLAMLTLMVASYASLPSRAETARNIGRILNNNTDRVIASVNQ